MKKNPQIGEDIHIVPGITGKRDVSGALIIIDDDTGEQLYPEDNIEHKIRIFERQVNGWFLKQASHLLEKENSGFVILMIATAYIEGVEQYRQGKSSKNGKSGTFFEKGIKRIFGIDSISNLYKELRCDLFHNGMTGPKIRISSHKFEKPLNFLDNGIIEINQQLFLEKVKEDFRQYLTDLRDDTQKGLRENFNKMYKFT